MPNWYARLNLASAIFPFYSEAAGRTIMSPGLDENFDRYNAANTTPDKGVPQVYYMHNTMPIAGGFQSIGYTQKLAPIGNGAVDFDHAFTIRNSDLANFIFSPAAGNNYIFDGNVGAWASVAPFAAGSTPANALVTTAYVQGQTYIYYSGIGCYKYDDVGLTLTPVTLTSLNPANVLGITAANGYMIAWTSNSIAWSSLTTPTDFTPSIQTGAGGGGVNDAKGAIKFCVPISGGFIVYCEGNAVGASYTGNTSFPYIFLEITGSGGCDSPNKVGWTSTLPYHIALTTAGIQSMNINNAQFTMPEVTDFLAAKIYEDFDEPTLKFSQQTLGSQLSVKIAAVSDRFIVISYGVNAPDYTYAIVYDIALNRYGKLKIAHRSCFPYNNPTAHGSITYTNMLNTNTTVASLASSVVYNNFFNTINVIPNQKEQIAFLQKDGTVKTVTFDLSETGADGVFLLGKFQMVRGNMMTHQKTDVEVINNSNQFNFYLVPSYNGKDLAPPVLAQNIKSGNTLDTYALRLTANNISILFVGAYYLTSVVIQWTIGGSR